MLFNAIAILIGGLALFDLIFFSWLFWKIRKEEKLEAARKQQGGGSKSHSDCGCPKRKQ